jgi:hypothetical protein
MNRELLAAALACLLGLTLVESVYAQTTASPVGLWLSQDGKDVTEIRPCEGSLCGRLVQSQGLKAEDRDARNPNPSLRNEPLCNQVYMGGFKRETEARWVSGWAYDSRDGGSYTNVALDAKGEVLEVTVRIGLIRHVERMSRLDPAKVMRCSMLESAVLPLRP